MSGRECDVESQFEKIDEKADESLDELKNIENSINKIQDSVEKLQGKGDGEVAEALKLNINEKEDLKQQEQHNIQNLISELNSILKQITDVEDQNIASEQQLCSLEAIGEDVESAKSILAEREKWVEENKTKVIDLLQKLGVIGCFDTQMSIKNNQSFSSGKSTIIEPMHLFGDKLSLHLTEKYKDIANFSNKMKLHEICTYKPLDEDTCGSYLNGHIEINTNLSEAIKKMTETHEYLHYLSDKGNKELVLGNIKIGMRGLRLNFYEKTTGKYQSCRNKGINEGVTELLASQNAKELDVDFDEGDISYRYAVELMRFYESIIGNGILATAYFKSKPDMLEKEFNEVMGSINAWNEFSEKVDITISQNSSKQEKYDAYETCIFILEDYEKRRGNIFNV